MAISLLSAYTFVLLNFLDSILVNYIAGYHSTGTTIPGVIVFFVFSFIFANTARIQSWNRPLPYVTMALAIFFPLVAITSFLRLAFGLSVNVEQYYMAEYCDSSSELVLCGEAFSHIVYSMTVRALPIVLTVPLLFWVLTRFFTIRLQDKHEK